MLYEVWACNNWKLKSPAFFLGEKNVYKCRIQLWYDRGRKFRCVGQIVYTYIEFFSPRRDFYLWVMDLDKTVRTVFLCQIKKQTIRSSVPWPSKWKHDLSYWFFNSFTWKLGVRETIVTFAISIIDIWEKMKDARFNLWLADELKIGLKISLKKDGPNFSNSPGHSSNLSSIACITMSDYSRSRSSELLIKVCILFHFLSCKMFRDTYCWSYKCFSQCHLKLLNSQSNGFYVHLERSWNRTTGLLFNYLEAENGCRVLK